MSDVATNTDSLQTWAENNATALAEQGWFVPLIATRSKSKVLTAVRGSIISDYSFPSSFIYPANSTYALNWVQTLFSC